LFIAFTELQLWPHAGVCFSLFRTGDSMKSIRRFWFAVVLTLSALSQFAGLARAQSPVQGRFNLPYEVNWENTVVPAGDYEFYLRSAGTSELLTIQKVGGSTFGFLVLARAPEPATSRDLNKLVFVMKDGKRFVSSMQLPEFGMGLAFVVQDKAGHAGKQIAQVAPMSAPPPAR
jgi:hypothetical protein